MVISANGIVINEYGDVLLVKRDDTRTLAPPGGALEINELPPEAAIREIREETGLIVHPVRLVGLYYLPWQPDPYLFLCFRCIPRDGKLSTSDETPRSGFFRTNPLPDTMVAFHKEQVEQGFTHSGGPPSWKVQQMTPTLRITNILLNSLVYPWLQFRRSRRGQPAYVPPPQWRIRSTLALSAGGGETLLLYDQSSSKWSLPSSDTSIAAPPWILAEQLAEDTVAGSVTLTDLSGIYVWKDEPLMEFVFTGQLDQSRLHLPPSSQLFAANALPQDLAAAQREMIIDSSVFASQTIYKLLE